MHVVLVFIFVVLFLSLSFTIGLYFVGVFINYYVKFKNKLFRSKETKYLKWLKSTDKEINDLID